MKGGGGVRVPKGSATKDMNNARHLTWTGRVVRRFHDFLSVGIGSPGQETKGVPNTSHFTVDLQ